MTPATTRLLSLPLVLSLAVGCTYVSAPVYEEKLANLDADGDKVPRSEDCDDDNADRSPNNEEIPYDGIDNDCDGNDVVDLDGDSYPGILQSEWTAQHDGIEWPTSVKADQLDCNDDDLNIFPGKASDPPYDGVDADCDCGNDFDVDGDGDVPPEYEAAFADFQASSCNTDSPTFGDCDDFDDAANSSNTDDTPLDGVDADCSGDNDFDADGDGYMPDEVDANDFQDFLDLYHEGQAPAAWGASEFGDCDDGDATVNPGVASDTPYDGVDADCGCNTGWDNDFDADGDNWVRPGDAAALDTYASTWCAAQTQPADGGEGDCDDTDAAINPGQLDTLGDALDADCDGGVDSSPLTFGSFGWTEPRAPALARTDDHYILASAATSFTSTVGTVDEAGVALVFPATTSGPGSLPDGLPIVWLGAGTTYPIDNAVDLAATGASFTVATAYDRDGLTFLAATAYTYNALSGSYDRGNTDVSTVTPYASLDVALELDNNGLPWVWSVGASQLHVMHGDGGFGADDADILAVPSADSVFVTEAGLVNGGATACDATGCTSYEFDGNNLASALSQPYAADTGIDANGQDGVNILVDAATGAILDDNGTSFPVLSGVTVYAADASIHDGVAYIASVVDNMGVTEAWLTYGDPIAGTWTDVPLDLDAALTPTGAAVYADADRVALAISAEDGYGDDAIGWTFLGPQ